MQNVSFTSFLGSKFSLRFFFPQSLLLYSFYYNISLWVQNFRLLSQSKWSPFIWHVSFFFNMLRSFVYDSFFLFISFILLFVFFFFSFLILIMLFYSFFLTNTKEEEKERERERDRAKMKSKRIDLLKEKTEKINEKFQIMVNKINKSKMIK